jgi:hypothetical protein
MSIGLKETDKYIITCASSFSSPPIPCRAVSLYFFQTVRTYIEQKFEALFELNKLIINKTLPISPPFRSLPTPIFFIF